MSNLLFAEYTEILETGELSDIEILVGKIPNTKSFRLHSFILKVVSPYFWYLLSNKNRLNILNGIIKLRIERISVKVFEIIIKYIYSNELELGNNDFKINVGLLIAADELYLHELCSFIEEYLLMNEELTLINKTLH
ncbi:BTB/POZ protein [Rhizophagus clarus]|uniref:BTB/POZ protein n=1 Tax=Rhizophagus clarus TaxID=94130 RepID=A0A8H3M5D0_9GLOM|nr:BTB/POZ protein [Rhizophagus clarus]